MCLDYKEFGKIKAWRDKTDGENVWLVGAMILLVVRSCTKDVRNLLV